ncbi:tRNA methyltransferase, has a role in tRNA modification, partial [Cladochytrium tenue]
MAQPGDRQHQDARHPTKIAEGDGAIIVAGDTLQREDGHTGPLAQDPVALERNHVHAVYDAIADHFSATRYKDFVLSIAVLHHLATPARRAAAVAELLRILRPGGSLLVFVWALEQSESARRRFDAQDVYVPWTLNPGAQKKSVAGAARDDSDSA